MDGCLLCRPRLSTPLELVHWKGVCLVVDICNISLCLVLPSPVSLSRCGLQGAVGIVSGPNPTVLHRVMLKAVFERRKQSNVRQQSWKLCLYRQFLEPQPVSLANGS